MPFAEVVSRLSAWRPNTSAGATAVGHGQLTPVSEDGPAGVRRFHVLLGRGPLRSPLPMVLEVTRWSEALGTRLELLPRAHVHASHRYFQSGHALLDALTAAVATPRTRAA